MQVGFKRDCGNQVTDVRDPLSKTLSLNSTEPDDDGVWVPAWTEEFGARFGSHTWTHDNQRDDDELRNWCVDDSELDSFDKLDEDGGPLTPSNHPNS